MGAAGARDEGTAQVGAFSAAQVAELERQAHAFELLAAVFGQRPSEALLTALTRPEAAQALGGAGGCAGGSQDAAVGQGAAVHPHAATGSGAAAGRHAGRGHALTRALAKLASAWERDPAATLDTLCDEYAVLLERPGRMVARPWGSCYLEADGALFGAETLAVRRAYAARGFLPAGYPHEADDHLAFELGFLTELTYAACDALDAGDEAGCAQVLAERDAFAAEHLRPWVARFADELGASPLAKEARLYPQAAAATAELVHEFSEDR